MSICSSQVQTITTVLCAVNSRRCVMNKMTAKSLEYRQNPRDKIHTTKPPVLKPPMPQNLHNKTPLPEHGLSELSVQQKPHNKNPLCDKSRHTITLLSTLYSVHTMPLIHLIVSIMLFHSTSDKFSLFMKPFWQALSQSYHCVPYPAVS